jgi:hypothetical protein
MARPDAKPFTDSLKDKSSGTANKSFHFRQSEIGA